MKAKLFGVALAAFSLIFGAHQGNAETLNLATGLDSSDALQTVGGSLDANWQVTGANSPLSAPNAYVVAPGNAAFGPPWEANGPNSSWILANPNDSHANGVMTFTLTFYVSNPSQASIINGRWIIDDVGTLTLNGHLLSTNGACSPCTNDNTIWPNAFSTFSTVPGDFVAGENTLVMQGSASDNWFEGARLEGQLVVTPVVTPLPAALPLFATGLGALGLLGWRRKRKQLA